MTVRSAWYDDGHTLIIREHQPNWTWAQLHDDDANVLLPILDSSPRPAALVVDMTRSAWMPLDDFAEHLLESARVHEHPRLVVVVFAVPDREVLALLRNAHERYGARGVAYDFAHRFDDAIASAVAHRDRGRQDAS